MVFFKLSTIYQNYSKSFLVRSLQNINLISFYIFIFYRSPHHQLTDLNILFSIQFWLISALRFTLGIILVFTVRLTIKKLVLSIVCHVFGVSFHDKYTHRQKEIEVTYKFVTYFSVGFVVVVIPFFIDALITF